ncbi:hypothetical protein G7Y89_g6787 [Cudoniella acicularis]|uniref:Uncharacterized protein n=1 Tax=Cudoniella acicularis TaxID=354080 RepID=A0A8H4RJR6_9HELO|nr:hypothetical protein G7Y89_g6787 [Cudoniella acicularis]
MSPYRIRGPDRLVDRDVDVNEVGMRAGRYNSTGLDAGAFACLTMASPPACNTTTQPKSPHEPEEYTAAANMNSSYLRFHSSNHQMRPSGVDEEYLLFPADLTKDDEKGTSDINVAVLQNFLEVLTIIGVGKKPKRVILTTCAKQYGVHIGPAECLMLGSGP